MKVYNPKDWLPLLLETSKSDTLKRLIPLFIGLGLYSFVIKTLYMQYLSQDSVNMLKNISIIYSILGFVLSLLLVFRTNTAYDRWWEGRKHWGSLVNVSRNMAIKLDGVLDKNDKSNRDKFSKLISLFAHSLKYHLQNDKTAFQLDELSHPEFESIYKNDHKPIYIVTLMNLLLQKHKDEGIIDNYNFLAINDNLNEFMNICGACERIKNTPIPYSYSVFIKKFIFIYLFTLPLGYAESLGLFIIPIEIFVTYVLISLELIAEEIEDPFNLDDNDIPTDKLSDNITNNVTKILS